MFEDALASLKEIFSPPFRGILYKSLGLTIAILAASWIVLEHFAAIASTGAASWIVASIKIAAALGLFVGALFLIAPVSMLVAGFFFDEMAEHVETIIYPANQGGRVAPASQSIWLAIKFSAVALVVNLVAFALWLLPGVNALVFFVANAYLFGREYFELAALRFGSLGEVRELRRRHPFTIYASGLLIAIFVATPGLNLVTPLFGTAFMVRLRRRLASPELTSDQAIR